MLASIETKEDLKNAILRNLQKGEKQAIKKRDLAKLIGAEKETDQRLMRMAIQEMRHAGQPIISGPNGYFLAASAQDVLKAKEYLTSYIKSFCVDLRDYKKILNEYSGQMSLRL